MGWGNPQPLAQLKREAAKARRLEAENERLLAEVERLQAALRREVFGPVCGDVLESFTRETFICARPAGHVGSHSLDREPGPNSMTWIMFPPSACAGCLSPYVDCPVHR